MLFLLLLFFQNAFKDKSNSKILNQSKEIQELIKRQQKIKNLEIYNTQIKQHEAKAINQQDELTFIKPHSLNEKDFTFFLSKIIKDTFPFTYDLSYYQQVYHYDDWFSFIAVNNGEKAGVLIAKLNINQYLNIATIDVQLVAVFKDQRHHHIGQSLFNLLFEEIRKCEIKITRAELHVISDNKVAQTLYQNNGFNIVQGKHNSHMYYNQDGYIAGDMMVLEIENNLRKIEAFI